MERVEHFGHSNGWKKHHKLTLYLSELYINNLRGVNNRDYITSFRCHACCQRITFPAYICEDCFNGYPTREDVKMLPPADTHNILSILDINSSFMLHKSCFDLPMEIEYLHHSKHKLTLRTLSLENLESFICDACEYIFHGFSYHCFQCQINICVQCVSVTRTFDYQQILLARESKKLFHFSHLHPLMFCKSVSRVTLYLEYCKICNLPLSLESYGFDPSYGCVDCGFFIHESCKDMPRTIFHPTHPLHGPLSMFDFTYTNVSSTCFLCNNKKNYLYEYLNFSCRVCPFNLHMKCAYSSLCTLKHECHLHDIIYQYTKIIDPLSCYVCDFSIVPMVEFTFKDVHFYRCVSCKVNFHFNCVPIPSTIKHKCHIHFLILSNEIVEDIYGVYYCDICELERNPKHYRYSCEECCFAAHIHCTLYKEDHSSNMSFSLVPYIEDEKDIKQEGMELEEQHRKEGNQENTSTQIKHVRHQHPLYLCDDILEAEDIRKCKLCICPINGPAYSCQRCSNVWMHKSCGELPPQIQKHHLHKSCIHPLSLLYHPLEGSKLFICHNCRNMSPELRYFCRNCRFTLDITCAFLNETVTKTKPFTSKDREETNINIPFIHEHTLVLTYPRNILYECGICETSLKGECYSCLPCKYYHYHKSCLKYLNEHWHRSFDSMHPLQCSNDFTVNRWCYACGLSIARFKYCCNTCNIIIHAKCVDFLILILRDNIHEHTYFYFPDGYLQSLSCYYETNFYCEICSKECMGSFYRCGECRSNVHSKCLKLPRIVRHKCHWHPLTLMDSLPEDDSGEYYCNVCEMERHPKLPVYYCEECAFEAHLHCILQENKSSKTRFNLICNKDVEQKKTLMIMNEKGKEIEEDDKLVKEGAGEKYFSASICRKK